ncbi:uncharacterized protein KY384_004793 [Bacidia gigantensis]|uniref:uncharacterized protein n=1 Tax=Bacidia gigantensis TaxID=2732470 RepID=UPI001D0594C4|nr:uncharacterized protein KY384_004793 [Bacidia gigantensis]KAG8530291.1 hypothetical protein KY384_004793 [Bacidia gigantensis]
MTQEPDKSGYRTVLDICSQDEICAHLHKELCIHLLQLSDSKKRLVMPHKHRRVRHADPSYWELPPSKIASERPLPSSKAPSRTAVGRDAKPSRKQRVIEDDTPRAFTRLLNHYRPPRSGLDDGERRPSKKRKTAPSATTIPPTVPQTTHDLKIRPHERLSHFSARVDAAIPFATVSKPNTSNDPALKDVSRPRKTKNERRMYKMQQAWREEDQKRKEARLAEGEEREGAVDEDGVEEMGVEEEGGVARVKRKGKRGREKEDDPWRELEARKKEEAAKKERHGNAGLAGIHDVVQAPPKLSRAMREGHGLPGRSKKGGMKERVEMSEARRSVIEGYRAMMRQKRDGAGAA